MSDDMPDFDAVYRGQSIIEGVTSTPPWDIGQAQPAIVDLERADGITSPVLDAGCGNGPVTIHLAERGYQVLGIDFSSAAIDQAREKAQARELTTAEFAVADVTAFASEDTRFATVIDCTLFHSMPIESREPYLAAMHRCSARGARLHLLCFSDVAPFPPDTIGPHMLGEDELRGYFGRGWVLDRLNSATIAANLPEQAAEWFSGKVAVDNEGHSLLPAWLATAHRADD